MAVVVVTLSASPADCRAAITEVVRDWEGRITSDESGALTFEVPRSGPWTAGREVSYRGRAAIQPRDAQTSQVELEFQLTGSSARFQRILLGVTAIALLYATFALGLILLPLLSFIAYAAWQTFRNWPGELAREMGALAQSNCGGEPESGREPKPASEPVSEPSSEPASEPASEPTPEPSSEPAPEPASEPAPEPASEPASEPALDPPSEPASEPLSEPASELAAQPTREAATGLVDINVATADELTELPGVGPSLAAKIVADRETTGRFSGIDDLLRVQGIGPRKLQSMRSGLTVQAGGGE